MAFGHRPVLIWVGMSAPGSQHVCPGPALLQVDACGHPSVPGAWGPWGHGEVEGRGHARPVSRLVPLLDTLITALLPCALNLDSRGGPSDFWMWCELRADFLDCVDSGINQRILH